MTKPLIGITTYVEPASWGHWHVEAALVPYDYVRAVERAGGRALLVPPDDSGIEEVLDALDGLIFSGGNDLTPDSYGAGALEQWHLAFRVNITSMFLVTKAFLPGMLRKGAGSILNMSSVASSVRGLPNRFAYGSSKAAVIGLTKSIAADFVRQGIRCNAVCPGTVDTPSLQERINALPDPVQARKDFIARQPMGRLGTVDDITGLLIFLASDESLFATGNAYPIDGGMTI